MHAQCEDCENPNKSAATFKVVFACVITANVITRKRKTASLTLLLFETVTLKTCVSFLLLLEAKEGEAFLSTKAANSKGGLFAIF